MSFRRTGHSDDRRRRVLRDELLSPTEDGDSGEGKEATSRKRGKATAGNGRSYSNAALASRQPPVTSLIVTGRLSLCLMLLLGLAVIVALEALYSQVFCIVSPERRTALAVLDVESRGSLAAWYGSLLLAAASAFSVMIYAIRRHRLDDYRARYRVWLWAACIFLAGSAEVATRLDAGLAQLIVGWQGERLHLEHPVWCLIIAGVVFGLPALRLIVEMRRSALAMAGALFSVAAYVTAACLRLGVLPAPPRLAAPMVESACVLIGHLTVLMTVLAYARFVYRQAQGETPAKPRKTATKPAEAKKTSSSSRTRETRSGRSVRVDPSHTPEAATSKPSSAPFTPPPPVEEEESEEGDDEAEGLPGDRSMSRSERRRLRKQQRKQGSSGH